MSNKKDAGQARRMTRPSNLVAVVIKYAAMSERKTIEERVLDYDQIRLGASALYDTFVSVDSAALGQKIVFTSEGFNHLIYSAPKKMRDKRAQILRFDMLPRAKLILERSTTFQEYDEEIVNKRVNRNGHWISKDVLVRYWGFVAVIQKFRVKAVVTQEGNGAIKFLSVVPAWFTKQYRNIKIFETSVGRGLKISDDNEVLKNATVSDAL